MTIVIDLPNETLVEILSFLSCPDLATISRVSHRFHSASQPLLYKAPCLLETRVTRGIRPSLELFLLTLAAPGNETLAPCVRSLTFEWNSVPDLTRKLRVDLTVLMAAVSDLDRFLPLAGQNTQFMLLLHLLPSLKVLHMRRPTANFLRFLQSQKSLGPTGPAGLKYLREFHCLYDTPGCLPPNALVALLQLPSLDHIDARVSQRDVHASYALKHVPHSSRVTKLRFADSNLPPAQLLPILSIPIALTHFSFTAATTDSFDIPGFMVALAPVRITLQCLHLDLQHVNQTTGLDTIPFVGESLREWPALRTLTCPLLALLGPSGPRTLADVLPPGLRQLAIVAGGCWPYGEVVVQMVGLLELKEIRVPVLEKVAVIGTGAIVDDIEFAQGILDVACQGAGVQCLQESFSW